MEAVVLEWCGYQQAAVEAANDPDVIADSDNEDNDESSSVNEPNEASFHTQRWYLMHPRERVITRNQHFPEKLASEIIPGEFEYRKDGGVRKEKIIIDKGARLAAIILVISVKNVMYTYVLKIHRLGNNVSTIFTV